MIGRRHAERAPSGAARTASVRGPGPLRRALAWVVHHRLSASDSIARIVDQPFSSVLTWLVVGIALALPVSLLLTLDNVRRVVGNVDERAGVTLFLAPEMELEAARELGHRLAARPDVAGLELLPRSAALEEFRARSGFADVLAGLEDNPLPHALLITPRGAVDDGALPAALAAAIEEMPGIAEVVVDTLWLKRLGSLMQLGQRVVLVLGVLLFLGVILILGNTIRLAIESRREEIAVVRLVGGSNAFVRRPFLYTGLWYGIGGGVFAVLLLSVAGWVLQPPVQRLAEAYATRWELQGLGVIGAGQLVLVGGALGLLAAWLAVARHLAAMEPR